VRKGKQYKTRVNLKAKAKTVIDEAKIVVITAEDTIERVIGAMPETAEEGDIARFAAQQLADLRSKLGPDEAHAEAVRWVFKVDEVYRRYKAKTARAAGARGGKQVKNAPDAEKKVAAYRRALADLEAQRGDSKPTQDHVIAAMKRHGVSISRPAFYRLRKIVDRS
jgi:hypothetical protein